VVVQVVGGGADGVGGSFLEQQLGEMATGASGEGGAGQASICPRRMPSTTGTRTCRGTTRKSGSVT